MRQLVKSLVGMHEEEAIDLIDLKLNIGRHAARSAISPFLTPKSRVISVTDIAGFEDIEALHRSLAVATEWHNGRIE